ncbi:MAG: lipopolysaccharide kinase InaA family protein [Phycisphaerales bacterium]
MTTRPTTHSANHERTAGEGTPWFVAADFRDAFARLGLTSLEAVFTFDVGRNLAKPNIGRFRRRVQLEAKPAGSQQPVKLFLKCYDRPPFARQVGNWFSQHARRSFASAEREAIEQLAAVGVNTPHIVACGEQWGILFERRSFLMTEEIRGSQSLEQRLPKCFDDAPTPAVLRTRREFIRRLAEFIRRFHATGRRHRDLYLAHIFCSDIGEFCLIDLARASRPFLQRRFQIKDIAQLHYSSPAGSFSRTDRLRFYLTYADRRRLLPQDKAFLRAVMKKTARMVRHNVKHGATPPYLEGVPGGR